jgi:predicted nuclease of restriction endonuclease-like (RecB) superfamily
MSNELTFYKDLLGGIKARVRQGQTKVFQSANTEMLATYWDIGKMIHERQQLEGWGKGVIPRLAVDLKNELSDVKGFSERNINYMLRFYSEYQSITILQRTVAKLETDKNTISPLPVSELETDAISIRKPSVSQLENDTNSISPMALAKLQANEIELITKISWSHHIILMQKIKDLPTRYWYMQQVAEQGWSRDTLVEQIKSNIHERQGSLVHNFETTLPDTNANWAKNLFKDPYIFDFTLGEKFIQRPLYI